MSENCSFWSLLLSGQKANIQLNLHTATFLQRPIFGRNSIHWHLFRPLYNGHFLLLPRSPFYLLVKVANWSQVSLHCWKSGIWSSLIIYMISHKISLSLFSFKVNSILAIIRTTTKFQANNNLKAFDWNKLELLRTLANEATNQTNSRSRGWPL